MKKLHEFNKLPIGLWSESDFDVALNEIFKDPIFDMDSITIGDIEIIKWKNRNPKYQAVCEGDVAYEGNDLFEILRKLFC